MMKRIFNISLLTASIMTMAPCILQAQAPGFGGSGVTDTPIDGGISILLAAGAGYGVKKIKESRSKSKQNTDCDAEK